MNRAPPQIFDRKQTLAKCARAAARQRRDGSAGFLTQAIADDIAERLDFMRLQAKNPLIVGDSSGTLSGSNSQPLGAMDEEQPHAFEAYDLFVHLLGLGMVNDLPGALIHARNSLTDGGIFIAAFPGAGSLPVLRQLALNADDNRPAARIHPQVDIRAGTALLERALFKRQVVDSYPLKVRYSSLDRLIADLRDHGLTSSLASPAPPITRKGWQRARAAFDALREEDGKVTETFEILVLTGWR